MADDGFKRKLAAILSADVEGYSRLMDDDEDLPARCQAMSSVLAGLVAICVEVRDGWVGYAMLSPPPPPNSHPLISRFVLLVVVRLGPTHADESVVSFPCERRCVCVCACSPYSHVWACACTRAPATVCEQSRTSMRVRSCMAVLAIVQCPT